jgi:hypothetical protein
LYSKPATIELVETKIDALGYPNDFFATHRTSSRLGFWRDSSPSLDGIGVRAFQAIARQAERLSFAANESAGASY